MAIAIANAVFLSVFLGIGTLAAPLPQPTSDLCGRTIVTSVVLDHDLVCAGNAITVGADGVTVFLNGHSIVGPSRGPPSRGITVVGRTAVSIVGPGNVTNFRTGISISLSHQVLVTRVAVFDNGLFGFVDGDGIRVLSSTDVTIEKCDVLGNGNDGIEIAASTGVLLSKNEVAGSVNGIDLGSAGNVLDKNGIALNTCGVKGSTDGNEFRKNRFTANTADFCA